MQTLPRLPGKFKLFLPQYLEKWTLHTSFQERKEGKERSLFETIGCTVGTLSWKILLLHQVGVQKRALQGSF